MILAHRLLRWLAAAGLLALALAGMLSSARSQALEPLRFVDGTGTPLAGANLRLLCYNAASPAALQADLLRRTGADGRLTEALPAGCERLAALRLVHTQPGKPGRAAAYQVFFTSFAPGSSTPLPAAGDIALRPEWPLVLFDVAASLEWQPAPGSRDVAELRAGLRAASAYLYDLSEGQMAFGPLTISGGGVGWASADMRFRAANDYRPSARVGGIVSAPVSYTTPTGLITTFAPGDILLGRLWDGRGAANPSTGAWTQPNAYRTLVHEWGHYGMFLFDSYQQRESSGPRETYCTCVDLPQVGRVAGACGGVAPEAAASAMSFHYTASQLFLGTAPASCTNTDQVQVHGESDWDTLLRWSRIQGLPNEWLQRPAAVQAGPALSLVADLFGRVPDNSGTRMFLPLVAGGGGTAPFNATVSLNTSQPIAAGSRVGLLPQVYSVGTNAIYQGTTDGAQSGETGLGNITLVGLNAGDQLRVSLDRYASAAEPGGRFVYPARGSSGQPPAAGQALQLLPDPWGASLDIQPIVGAGGVSTLEVSLRSRESLAVAPTLALCVPGAGCATPVNFQPGAGSSWTARLTSGDGSELPSYGVLRVAAAGRGELLRWYIIGGGVGPAHIRGNAPLADGLVTVDAPGATGNASRLVFMPAANFEALNQPLPAGVGGIIGQPLDVKVTWPSGGAVPFSLTLFYPLEVAERLGVEPSRLRVLRYDPAGQAWQPVPVSGFSSEDVAPPPPQATATVAPSPTPDLRVTVQALGSPAAGTATTGDTSLAWVATQAVSADGIYAVGWATGP